MKLHELERLHPTQRRRFLKWLGLAVAGPMVTPDLRHDVLELAGGKAHAQGMAEKRPTYFIELNLRDQWDNGHVFVAPGLASKTDLARSASGANAALFYKTEELKHDAAKRVYLTNESKALEPHLDHIAMVDACVPSLGAIHGHESANDIRSPGRTYSSTGGLAMWNNDPVSNFPAGCEAFYGRVPTPAALHNYYQKTLDPTLRNGFAFKGISRSIHTAYHFGAGL
ncbi:MAG: hypothetical protein KC416_16085, partial [Myxococcales bacterium]|nr:hypothetical protein [Myxococcales bacterium]